MPPRILLLKAAACLSCAALFLIRVRLTETTTSASCFGISSLRRCHSSLPCCCHASGNFSRAIPVLAVWLLFFPNAPYVLTDLIHLRQRAGVPLWFDLVMILAFAFTSLWIGFHSLRLVQRWIARHCGPRLGWTMVLVVMPLTGFGLYLGRMLRWNSWDILTRPFSLLRDIGSLVMHPLAHHDVWLFTFGFGFFLLLAYYVWDREHALMRQE
jgi:uncharacterized membrane protein